MTFRSLAPRRFQRAHPAASSLRPVWQLSNDFDQLFDDVFRGSFFAPTVRAAARLGDFTPRMDVTESDEAYRVQADLPGVAEKDIQVSLQDGVLTIQGKLESEKVDEERTGFRHVERASGSFHRAIELPEQIDAEGVKASYQNGVLTVTVPKKAAPQPQVRSIPITTA
jgi:HSP20 family protein